MNHSKQRGLVLAALMMTSVVRGWLASWCSATDTEHFNDLEAQPLNTSKPIVTDGGHEQHTEPDGYDSRSSLEQLNEITQVTRANLVQNIVGHRWLMPSKKELDYYNPTMSAGNISNHLGTLEDAGVISRVVVPQGDRTRDGPRAFYILTEEGYQLLSMHSLFLPEIKEIRDDHDRLDKSDEIERYENARRPTVTVGYPHPLKGDGVSVVDPAEYVDEFDVTELLSHEDKDGEGQSTERATVDASAGSGANSSN